MYTFISITIIGAILGIILPDSFINRIVGFFVGTILGLIAGMLLTTLIGEIGYKTHPEYIKTYPIDTIYIQNLNDNSTVTGHFTLGTGMVNGTMRYFFYSKLNDNTFQLQSLSMDEAIIKYTNNQPKIIMINKMWETNWGISDDNYYYIIYVRKGTITNNFILDAK